MKKISIKKFIFVIFTVSVFITGCHSRNDYMLDEILNGFSFKNNGNEFTLNLKDGSSYSFGFDNVDTNNNYFYNKINEEEVYYYYNNNIIKTSDCQFEILEKKYSNCSESEEKIIINTKNNFEFFLNEMKISQENLSVVSSDVKSKKINISDKK